MYQQLLILRTANSFGETYGVRKCCTIKTKRVETGTVETRKKGIAIKAELVTARSKKIPNWKAAGPDGVLGYWIKSLIALHVRVADHLDYLINNRVTIPA